MPATRRAKPLYQRGGFRLDARPGRNHVVTWYDVRTGRERSLSAGTTVLEDGKHALDAIYLEQTQGQAICPTCGQPRSGAGRFLVTDAIANYQTAHGDARTSGKAIRARLAHPIAYIATLSSPAVYCEDIDPAWIERFRTWTRKQPVAATGRPRSPSTIENSVLQLAAAINYSHRRGDALKPAQFRSIPAKEVNRTPRYRADVATIAAMFRYAMTPNKRRESLLAFLRVSLVTLARPDAAHDASTSPVRGQWSDNRQVLDLNPRGRRQTKKYRATVPIARQALWLFREADGPLVPVASVKRAFHEMAVSLKLPPEGESGLKVIRRSVATILRDRGVPANELELMLGHRKLDSTSELYAPFDPDYLAGAKRAIEALIDELETLAPGALCCTLTAQGENVVSIGSAK